MKTLIEENPDLYMGFVQMYKEAEPSVVPDYIKMLCLIDDVISRAPAWNDPFGSPGLTFNNILASVVITPSGFAAFCNDKLNEKFRLILDDWKKYVESPKSADSLTKDAWLSNESIFKLSTNLPGFDPYRPCVEPFQKAFVKESDRSDAHWGFKSWDGFFARPFLDIDVIRPIDPPAFCPACKDNAIVSACESRVYGIATNVSDLDTFWIKGNRYSLKLLLKNDARASQFTGGTVYQCYLSTADYHRWTMPFSGTIKDIVTVRGTYFALPPALVDTTAPEEELTSIIEACAYLSVVSARKLVFIEADNPNIGLACFICVGLQEVSSCDVLAKKDIHYNKGDELGMFHFGGSTTCLVFRPETQIKWEVDLFQHVKIRTKIGTVY